MVSKLKIDIRPLGHFFTIPTSQRGFKSRSATWRRRRSLPFASGASQKWGCHQRPKCREMHQRCGVHPSKIDLTQNNENIYSTPKWGCKSTNKICIWPFKKLDSKALKKWIFLSLWIHGFWQQKLTECQTLGFQTMNVGASSQARCKTDPEIPRSTTKPTIAKGLWGNPIERIERIP